MSVPLGTHQSEMLAWLVDNWLDTAGHARGTMCLRWIGADEHPEPRTRVTKLTNL